MGNCMIPRRGMPTWDSRRSAMVTALMFELENNLMLDTGKNSQGSGWNTTSGKYYLGEYVRFGNSSISIQSGTAIKHFTLTGNDGQNNVGHFGGFFRATSSTIYFSGDSNNQWHCQIDDQTLIDYFSSATPTGSWTNSVTLDADSDYFVVRIVTNCSNLTNLSVISNTVYSEYKHTIRGTYGFINVSIIKTDSTGVVQYSNDGSFGASSIWYVKLL